MLYLVKAYNAEGNQILGNTEGQGFHRAKCPERCQWFKTLATRETLNNRVSKYRVFRVDGNIFADTESLAEIALIQRS